MGEFGMTDQAPIRSKRSIDLAPLACVGIIWLSTVSGFYSDSDKLNHHMTPSVIESSYFIISVTSFLMAFLIVYIFYFILNMVLRIKNEKLKIIVSIFFVVLSPIVLYFTLKKLSPNLVYINKSYAAYIEESSSKIINTSNFDDECLVKLSLLDGESLEFLIYDQNCDEYPVGNVVLLDKFKGTLGIEYYSLVE